MMLKIGKEVWNVKHGGENKIELNSGDIYLAYSQHLDQNKAYSPHNHRSCKADVKRL